MYKCPYCGDTKVIWAPRCKCEERGDIIGDCDKCGGKFVIKKRTVIVTLKIEGEGSTVKGCKVRNG